MIQGRDKERDAIAALIEGARGAHGGALVVRGLAGVGKSTLLNDAVSRAEGMQVLRTQGVESESPLAFAAMHRLLRPLMPYADRLPAPQTQALRTAFGEITSTGVDRFMVFLAVLSLLSEAAEHNPIFAVVDDAQWLDEVSAAALLFVARRLDAERVAVLFAARDGDERRFDSADLSEFTLGGLDHSAAADLLAERAGLDVPEHVAGELVQRTGGNPLILVELADLLSPEQLAGIHRLPDHLPLTAGMERAFLERYRKLPDSAQLWMLVAATDDAGHLATVRQAAQTLGAGDEATDAAEQSGLVRIESGQLLLRHPLVRSAVYGAATEYRRGQAHRALAGVLTGEDDKDRRAWHLAAAAQGPEPAVAAELKQVAERASRRGGHEAASAAWQRAAELTADTEDKAQLLYKAAENSWLAGQTERARVLADNSHALASTPAQRADAALLLARIEWNTGSLMKGHYMVLQGAKEVAEADPGRARELGMFAAALASVGGDSGGGISPVDLATGPGPGASARESCFWHLLEGFDHMSHGDIRKAAPVLRAAFADGASLENADQDILPNLGIAAMHVGDEEAALHYHNLLLARARNSGSLVTILYALTRRGLADIATAAWQDARTGAAEALQLARGTGQPSLTAFPLALQALIDALQDDEAVSKHVAAAEYVAQHHSAGTVAGVVRDINSWTRAICATQPEEAYHHLSRLKLPWVKFQASIDRFECAVRAGQRDQANHWVSELEAFAAATGNAWATAASFHGRAILEDGDAAEKLFLLALEHHASSLRVVDRARTQLAFGQYLRRQRRRVDARAHLQAALETFANLGARRWEELASQELRASGKTARKRNPSTAAALTAQERQVAALVQQGMSNREVAAQLFLSPRTIDFHLRNVFAKLGITTRVELVHQRFDASPEPTPV